MIPRMVYVQAIALPDQTFSLPQIFEKSWEYTKKVYTCFVELKKAYN